MNIQTKKLKRYIVTKSSYSKVAEQMGMKAHELKDKMYGDSEYSYEDLVYINNLDI